VTFIADYESEPWSWFANVAYTQARFGLPEDQADSRRDLWRVSVGTEYALLGELRLAGEIGVRTNEAKNDPFAPGKYGQFVMLGVIYSPAKKVELNVAMRKGLNDAEVDTVWLAGVSFRW
jgi:long-subunit fatty acid transport protein